MIALRLVLVITLAPAAAFAQQAPVTSPAKPGPTVIVQDNKGAETKGKLLRLDVREAVLMIDGQERRFALADVRRIEKRGDSLINGALIGAGVGLVAGLFATELGLDYCGGSRDSVYWRCEGPSPLGLGAAALVLGSAIGAGVDALLAGRTTLYQAPAGTAVLELRPASIALRVRW